jgi:hypothetical protein
VQGPPPLPPPRMPMAEEDPFVAPVDLPDALRLPGRLPTTATHGAVVAKTAEFVAQRPQVRFLT